MFVPLQAVRQFGVRNSSKQSYSQVSKQSGNNGRKHAEQVRSKSTVEVTS